jgi:hypothetical protein
MLLFSAKHFSRNAWFTLFIYVGIAVRASLALIRRFADFSAGFLLEFGISFLGMAIIKDWWELNFKGIPGMYPAIFIQMLVPAYLLVWLASTRIAAAYSRDYNPMVILKGIILGTVIISGITNFFDDYRFSKGLILIGAAWTWTICTLRLIGWRLIQSKKLLFNLKRKQRILVCGNADDYANARNILGNLQHDVLLCGYCGPETDAGSADYLGTTDQLPSLAFRLGVDELLFCQGSISNKEIIHGLEKFRNLQLRFSILGPGGRHLVCSSEKHSRGSVLKSDSIPELLLPHNLRLKRLCDLGISLLLIPAIPFLLLKVESVVRFFGNFLAVLTGKRTWVGTESREWQRFGLKPAVVSSQVLAGIDAEPALVESLDKLYLQEFLAEHEIWTVLKNLKHLGRKTGE